MSNENLKKTIEELKKNAEELKKQAKLENQTPNDLLKKEELDEISGGTIDNQDLAGDCSGYSCGVHW